MFRILWSACFSYLVVRSFQVKLCDSVESVSLSAMGCSDRRAKSETFCAGLELHLNHATKQTRARRAATRHRMTIEKRWCIDVEPSELAADAGTTASAARRTRVQEHSACSVMPRDVRAFPGRLACRPCTHGPTPAVRSAAAGVISFSALC